MVNLRSHQLKEANQRAEQLQSEVVELKKRHRHQLEQLTERIKRMKETHQQTINRMKETHQQTIKRMKETHQQTLADAEAKVLDLESQVGGLLKQMVIMLFYSFLFLFNLLLFHFISITNSQSDVVICCSSKL